MPEHENDESDDKAANNNLLNEHNTNIAADKQSKTIAIKVLPNEEHHDKLTVDKHAKKVAIKVIPNDEYQHGFKTDQRINKDALRVPNDAQDQLTYYYSTKTQPKSGATHKTTYHYSTKIQPIVTELSSGQKMNGSALNLWNNDLSGDLYSYTTRRVSEFVPSLKKIALDHNIFFKIPQTMTTNNDKFLKHQLMLFVFRNSLLHKDVRISILFQHEDNQDHKLSHDKKMEKILFSKEFLELLIKHLNTQVNKDYW